MKLFTLGLLFLVTTASAQWTNTTNLFYDSLHMPVCTAPQNQTTPLVVRSFPDSGFFIIWADSRNAAANAIYTQKFDKAGNRLWAANGVPVAVSSNNQHYTYQGQNFRSRPFAASDGANGFYLTYADDSIKTYRFERVCLQHVKSDGSVVFPGPGYIIASSVTGNQITGPQLITDGNNGCYIAFSLTSSYIHAFNYKDVNGALQNLGGGIMNQTAVQVIANSPCGNYSYLNYPDATVWDYNIFSDLQGGCNIVMNLSVNGTGVMLGYNKLWRAKQNATVTQYYRDIDYSVKPDVINYTKDSVYRMYYLVTDHQIISCGSSANVYVVNQYRLIQNGFQIIDEGNDVYSLDDPKGVTVTTPGNTNASILLGVVRSYSPITGVSAPIAKAYAITDEIYDSIPYQRTSFTSPDYPGYNLTVPAGLPKLGLFADTALAGVGGSIFEASMAGGSNQVYISGLIAEDNLSKGYRNLRLQHLAIESAGADSLALVYKTDTKAGVIIGQDQQDYTVSNGQYDIPMLAVNNNGNALFYIKESSGSTGPARVSPIFNGAQLAWGAMGRQIGTGLYNGSVYNMSYPDVSLDPFSGIALLSWSDSRNVSTSSGDIYMRHLDNLNDPNYQPPYLRLRDFSDPYGPVVATMPLYGTSNAFSTFEARAPYGSDAGISPTVAISDNYDLGNVTVNTYENTSGIRKYNGMAYLDRSWVITPDNNPNGAATVKVRLFFTTDEFNALKAADSAISTPGDLEVIKQPSGTGSGSTYTVVAGEKTIIPTAWDSVSGGYYIEIQVTSFSNFFIFRNTNPLSVNWLGVEAQWQNAAQVKVSWQVADQEEVNTYTVQYSTDGKSYTDACMVTAEQTGTSYSCIVQGGNGKNYYRVVETDLDGKKNYSKVVVLEGAQPGFTMYPNPARNALYIDGLTNYKSLQITDANGHIVLRQDLASQKALVDIDRLAPGIYILTVIGNSDSKTTKFVKE